MDELSDEEISYEEYQSLVKAISDGARAIDKEIGISISVFHVSALNGIMQRLESPRHLFALYHRTASPPGDHFNEKVVWDLPVEYNGQTVSLRYLILKLEKLWNQQNMLTEGGV
jgi:hypothetical protein